MLSHSFFGPGFLSLGFLGSGFRVWGFWMQKGVRVQDFWVFRVKAGVRGSGFGVAGLRASWFKGFGFLGSGFGAFGFRDLGWGLGQSLGLNKKKKEVGLRVSGFIVSGDWSLEV